MHCIFNVRTNRPLGVSCANMKICVCQFCSLSELPECHMEIVCNEDVVDQLTCISLTPSVRIMSAQLVATLFLCVAYTPTTHPYISQPDFIRRLLKACDMDRVFGSNENKQLDTLMLRYTHCILLKICLLAKLSTLQITRMVLFIVWICLSALSAQCHSRSMETSSKSSSDGVDA